MAAATSGSEVKRVGMKFRREESMITLKTPTITAPTIATLAEVRADSVRVAPIRFAIRVLAAMERGKGIWKVMAEMVPRTDWAARIVVPRCDDARVRSSKARTSASTITRPGRARRIIGSQLWKARVVKPFQHSWLAKK